MSTEHASIPEISVLQDPKSYAQQYDGQRCHETDITNDTSGEPLVPHGWVVNGKADERFWGIIHKDAIAIPLMPKDRSLVGFMRRRELSDYQKTYGPDVMMVLIPDEESTFSWSGGPLRLSDLLNNTEDPSILLAQSLDLLRTGDLLESDMKRRAYMLLTGASDTK